MDKVILERDGQAQTVAAYTHEGGGLYHDLISMHRSDSYYHLFDGLGSVSEVTDGDEAVQNRYRYEAFGQFKLADETVPNPYTYVGAFGVQWDAGTGLHFMQARYYAGTIGRFISMDPFRGLSEDPMSLHRYLYTANSPVTRIDPTGLFDWDAFGLCLAMCLQGCVFALVACSCICILLLQLSLAAAAAICAKLCLVAFAIGVIACFVLCIAIGFEAQKKKPDPCEEPASHRPPPVLTRPPIEEARVR